MLAQIETKLPQGVPAEHKPTYRLEAEILKLPQVEFPVQHSFCSGLYARTIHIPADHILTGAVHRHDCFFVVRSGVLAVTTDDKPKVLYAGDMVVTKAGSKRAGVAITDVVVTTFHTNPEDETDPAALWDMFTVAPPMRFLSSDDLARLENEQ